MTRDEILNMPAGLEIDELVQSFVMEGLPPVSYDIIRDYVPKFSEDISAAWEVVEKMTKRENHWIAVTHESTSGNLWFCEYQNLDGTIDCVVADSAPLAICRAALLAITGV